jgi:hypothetical protein
MRKTVMALAIAAGSAGAAAASELPREQVTAAFRYAAEHTGYALPAELPTVYLTARENLVLPGRVNIGSGTGEPPRARTVYGNAIYMADDLGPLSRRAIAAHEATHWLQEFNGASRCPGLREWQAHVVHHDYMARNGKRLGVDWDRLRRARDRCLDAPN